MRCAECDGFMEWPFQCRECRSDYCLPCLSAHGCDEVEYEDEDEDDDEAPSGKPNTGGRE